VTGWTAAGANAGDVLVGDEGGGPEGVGGFVVLAAGGADETGADGGVRPHWSMPAAKVVSTTAVAIGRYPLMASR
jgi:hypothetical protein